MRMSTEPASRDGEQLCGRAGKVSVLDFRDMLESALAPKSLERYATRKER